MALLWVARRVLGDGTIPGAEGNAYYAEGNAYYAEGNAYYERSVRVLLAATSLLWYFRRETFHENLAIKKNNIIKNCTWQDWTSANHELAASIIGFLS